jgi:hypothetical protein
VLDSVPFSNYVNSREPWLDGLDGCEALMVTPSGLLRATDGWPAA